MSAIKTINELIDVLLQIIGRNAVEGTEQESLEVGDNQMHLRQPSPALSAGVTRA